MAKKVSKAPVKKVAVKATKKVVAKKSVSSVKVAPATKSAPKKAAAVKSTKTQSSSSQTSPVIWIVFLILAIIAILVFSKLKQKKMARYNQMMTPMAVSQVDGMMVSTVLVGATLQVPEASASVQLGSEVSNFTDGAVRGSVTLEDVFAAQRTANGYDVLGVVSVNEGGSGTQQYLVSYVVMGEKKMQTGSYFIGDRVQMESISIVPDAMTGVSTVTVNYLDRNLGEPMAAPPSIEATKTYTLENHVVSQVIDINTQ